MAYLYILYSTKLDRYYIGSTINLTRRFAEHQRGHTRSTMRGRPWLLVYEHVFESSNKAHAMELKLKSWKSRRIIEDIIKNGLRECSTD